MKAADQLQQKFGARIGASLGANRQGAAPVAPRNEPVAPAPGGARYQGCARIKDALTIEIDRIVPDPGQPRKEFDEAALDELAASLKARGQLQPCRVRWDGALGKWIIIAGERRWRAAVRAGLPTLQCVEARGTLTDHEILEDQLVENCLREDLKPIEQALAYRKLLDLNGWTLQQLAERLHMNKGTISRALALLDLPPEVQTQVEQGALAPAAAAEIATLADPAAQVEAAGRVVTEKLTRDELRGVVKAQKAGRAPTTARPRSVEYQTAGGQKVIIMLGPDDGPDAIVVILKDVLEQARAKAGAPAQDQAA
ncbi:MAG TPA: ParB/RepB/Spo0J family partition protein [Isosphaeraceae bacterium]|nr:ParB/RepB/Spo0J family partition protein [Isosphaeraceae bacterium]